jgi:polyisoprenoid-binding protein YceI
MKKFATMFCAVVMAALTALPAAAQNAVWTLDARIVEVQRAIDKGVADGALDRAQHDRIQFELTDIRRRRDDYSHTHAGHVTPDATQKFEAALDTVVNQIHWIRASEWRRPW